MFSCNKSEIVPSNSLEIVKVENLAPIPIFDFSFVPHKPRLKCNDGWGLCDGHLTVLGWPVFRAENGTDGTATTFEENGNLYLRMEFENDPFPNEDDFEVGDSFYFPEDIVDLYEASSVRIIGGTYELIDEDSNNKREVIVPLDVIY